ncbi:MAG: alkaline phosphatase family protein [Clostridiales bacterium]|nr:alkaline phosphatase family protein [Clostridiales bacterium]
MNTNIIYPDYSNSIANLANSILKKWELPTNGGTLKLLDMYLKKYYKNVVVILLDGMGKCIIERNLKKSGFFNNHLAGTYSSTFPPTTVAATVSIDNGLTPCEHGWLGWDCYFPQIDRNVTVYYNTDTESKEKVAEESIAWKYCGYSSVINKINSAGGRAHYVTPFNPPYPGTFEESCELIKTYCEEPGQKYIYCYCNEPDYTMHRTGCYSDEAKQVISSLEKRIESLADELKNTLVIVTADHGHVDTKGVCIKSYPKIMNCLKRIPSIEPRALNLFVKDDRRSEFEKEFTKEFGDKFLLLPKEKVLEMKLFGYGAEHKDFREMLGDYLAVAIDDLSIFNTEEEVEKFIGVHAGLTKDEMIIPLIIVEKE